MPCHVLPPLSTKNIQSKILKSRKVAFSISDSLNIKILKIKLYFPSHLILFFKWILEEFLPYLILKMKPVCSDYIQLEMSFNYSLVLTNHNIGACYIIFM